MHQRQYDRCSITVHNLAIADIRYASSASGHKDRRCGVHTVPHQGQFISGKSGMPAGDRWAARKADRTRDLLARTALTVRQ
jgi:hypothetical protein